MYEPPTIRTELPKVPGSAVEIVSPRRCEKIATYMSETVRLFADAWKVLIGRFPSARIEEADGVVSCIGNVSQVFFNASIINRPAVTHHELRALLDTAAERAADCHHPCGVIVREDWLPSGWGGAHPRRGTGAPLVPMTGMETTELLPPRRPAASAEIRRVASDATARDLVELNAHAYGHGRRCLRVYRQHVPLARRQFRL